MRLLLGGVLALVACSERTPALDESETQPPDAHLEADAWPTASDGGTGGEQLNADAAWEAGLELDATLAADASLSAEVLRVKVLRDSALDSGVRYQLLELAMGTRAPTYAQWFPPPDGGVRPVVVMTKPYDGIDWTGQEVDTRWAKQGAGLFPDVDAPPEDGGLGDGGKPRSSIAYQPLAPEKVEDHYVYGSLHNFGTLLLYGRFYAGGDVQNDIDDMTLGFEWLAQANDVDKKRIGIFGGSWGGFEALFAAAYARDDVKPAAGVALSPIADFEQEVRFITQDLPSKYSWQASRDACATFFEPYVRRIDATTKVRGGYEGLRAQDLAARIKGSFLLVHEDWDTLTVFDASKKLVELAPATFKPLWFLHSTPPFLWDLAVNKHGLLVEQFAQLASYAFATSHLLRHLGDEKQTLYMVWPTAQMRQLLAHVHQLQRDKVDVSFFAERLLELTDARIIAYDPAGPNLTLSGARAVADELNREYGTNYTATSVIDALRKGLPPP